jgi:hypothetical protein
VEVPIGVDLLDGVEQGREVVALGGHRGPQAVRRLEGPKDAELEAMHPLEGQGRPQGRAASVPRRHVHGAKRHLAATSVARREIHPVAPAGEGAHQLHDRVV